MNLIIPPASMKLSTGPVDDPFEENSDEDCPQCGDRLTVQWAQEGLCHSGLFATELLVDVYWCERCEQSFVDEADANDTAANEARKRRSARQVGH